MQPSKRTKKMTVDAKFIRTKRANELMKVAQSMNQTVYIYGATGFGKTSFVFDYLNRRRFHYFSAYNCEPSDIQKCYDNIEGQEAIVVIDNLESIISAEERETYYDAMERMIEDRNVWLILISRAVIPAWIMPLYIQKIFTIITEADLSFSEQEFREYLSKWDLVLMSEAEQRLREISQGFPLFCRIAAIRIQLACMNPQDSSNRAKIQLAQIEEARKDWWDYLDTYVFDQWELQMQEFLMAISVVERFDLQLAQTISKRQDAATLISRAQETGNFIIEHSDVEHVIYELREPIKNALRRRLRKTYSNKYIQELYYNAGSCYEYQDDVLSALRLYEKCHNEDGISRILINNSRKHAGVGHYWELKEYYLALPEETIKQSAELIAAMSMLQSILMNDEESNYWYDQLVEYTKNQTGSAKREAQARIIFLDISLPQRGVIKMVDILKNASALLTNSKLAMPEFSITNNEPTILQGGKDFSEWSKKDRTLAKSIGKVVEIVLGRYGKGIVNIALAESQFEKGGDNYEVSTLANKGRVQAESGGCLELQFVAVGILAQLSAMGGQLDDGIESLLSFKKSIPSDKQQMLAGVESLRIRFLLYMGNRNEVVEWLETAPDEDKEFCTLERFHYITKIRVYLALGKKNKALTLLQRLQYFAELRQRTYLQIEVGILLAITQYRMEDSAWKQTLQSAITLAEEYNFVRIFSREGAAIWELLKCDTFIWKKMEFKKQVMKECEMIAESYPGYLVEKQSGNIILSDMEIKVLRMQAEGMSVEKIADSLGLSKAGVKYYNQQTYKKLGVNSKAQAVNEAKNKKII